MFKFPGILATDGIINDNDDDDDIVVVVVSWCDDSDGVKHCESVANLSS